MNRAPEILRSWAAVNLSVLERNLRAIRAAFPEHLKYIAVVKANAYGHGLAPVVTRLMHSQADAFAVANLDEAASLREVGKGWPVLVLSALLPKEYPRAIDLKVCPVISSCEEALELEKIAAAKGTSVDVHIKIDTGMGRLGVWFTNFTDVMEELLALKHVQVKGLCTHFSSADTDPGFTEIQRERFITCIDSLPEAILSPLMIHADNSAGIESFPEKGPFNAARVGLLQFGVRPKKGSFLAQVITEPVLSYHARISLLKHLPAGTAVSYGQTYRLQKDSTIAILTAGYADGLTTAFSNRGSVIINDTVCPVIGRVTMDQVMVDVSAIDPVPHTGEVATFIGRSPSHSITVSDFSRASGQIEWEAFCNLSSRTQRIYLSDTAL